MTRQNHIVLWNSCCTLYSSQYLSNSSSWEMGQDKVGRVRLYLLYFSVLAHLSFCDTPTFPLGNEL